MTASRVSIERSEARSEMTASRVSIERSEARSEMRASRPRLASVDATAPTTRRAESSDVSTARRQRL